MTSHRLREWSRLPFGEGEDCIPESEAVRLCEAASRVPIGGGGANILALERGAVRAGQVVGLLAAEGCAIEILPKIDGVGDGGVRRRLVHMLNVAFGLDIDTSGVSKLGWQRDDLLEILILLFARKVWDVVRRGMPRRYVGCADDLPLLRGRLDVIRQFTVHAAAPVKLACRYDELSPDIALNRIIKAAVTRLSRMARSAESQRLLQELLFEYSGVSDVSVSALRWDEIILDRTNRAWREVLGLARLLLGDRFQDTGAGGQTGFSLLFEMNVLFESYIARMMDRALRPLGIRATAQGGRAYCLVEEDSGDGRFQTRPDILLRQGGTTRMIVDTKWKHLLPGSADRNRGVSQADIYQMIAYGTVYDCDRLVLLYPHSGKLGGEGAQADYRITGASGRRVTVATIDVGVTEDIAGRLRDLVTKEAGSRPGAGEQSELRREGLGTLVAEREDEVVEVSIR
jgi:5-methylcytosine-specific restriction enzyme subunit McrC